MNALRLTALILAAAATLPVAGCGLKDPYREPRKPPARQALAPGPDRARHEDASAPAPEPSLPQPTPQGTAVSFAQAWSNWRWQTIGAHQRRLLALATGAWAQTLQQGHPRKDDLNDSRPSSRGEVVSVAAVPNENARLAVVTREQTLTGPERGAPRLRLYRATVAAVRGGWAIADWEPLN